MKANIITIIKGTVISKESITYRSRAEFEAMLAFVADKEKESNTFKSIYMDNCVAWEEAGVKTIIKIEE